MGNIACLLARKLQLHIPEDYSISAPRELLLLPSPTPPVPIRLEQRKGGTGAIEVKVVQGEALDRRGLPR